LWDLVLPVYLHVDYQYFYQALDLEDERKRYQMLVVDQMYRKAIIEWQIGVVMSDMTKHIDKRYSKDILSTRIHIDRNQFNQMM
jgi:hypothetical protein